MKAVPKSASNGKSDEHIIAIGDVHGCARELNELLGKLPLRPDTTIVFLGDYIDRGPDSKGVIDTILDLGTRHHVVALMGNHETMLFDFLADPKSSMAGKFLYNGGSACLASYGDASGNWQIPASHIQFLKGLRLSYETRDYFFVHAGIPDVALSELSPEEHAKIMLWIRGPFLNNTRRWKKRIVHGHTPSPQPEVKPNRINLDTGCALGGRLTAMELPTEQIFQVEKYVETDENILRDQRSMRRAVRFEGSVPVVLVVGSHRLNYETLDYSERGMLCRQADDNGGPMLRVGDRILVEVGSDPDYMRRFDAQVVRRRQSPEGMYYGLALRALPGPDLL